MEYDRAFLIDKSPQHWSITFQQQLSIAWIILFREEVVQNIPFIWWDYWKELWKNAQIRFNYLLWHPVKYICITGFMFNSSH